MSAGPSPGLTHFGADGAARMVDVSAKPVSRRAATACARVVMRPETLALIRDGRARKGDVLAVARIAGILAAKRTPDLIPLCHALALSAAEIGFAFAPPDTLEITAEVRTDGQTGVEMEALTAVGIAALTVYDMVKSADRGLRITDIHLRRKSGGASGEFAAP